MPSVSKKQEKFMQAVANNPKFAKKAGVPQKVGKEFAMKDKEMKDMKKMGRGMAKATMAKKGMKGYAAGGMPMVEKDGKKVPAFAADGKGKMKSGGMAALKKHASMPASKAHKGLKSGGMACSYKKGADGVASKGKTQPKMMRKGGTCK